MGTTIAERELYMGIYFNAEMARNLGLGNYGMSVVQHSSAGAIFTVVTHSIDEAYDSDYIKYANESTFKIGSSFCKMRAVSYTCTVMGIQE